jgi:hypothetical protein
MLTHKKAQQMLKPTQGIPKRQLHRSHLPFPHNQIQVYVQRNSTHEIQFQKREESIRTLQDASFYFYYICKSLLISSCSVLVCVNVTRQSTHAQGVVALPRSMGQPQGLQPIQPIPKPHLSIAPCSIACGDDCVVCARLRPYVLQDNEKHRAKTQTLRLRLQHQYRTTSLCMHVLQLLHACGSCLTVWYL